MQIRNKNKMKIVIFYTFSLTFIARVRYKIFHSLAAILEMFFSSLVFRTTTAAAIFRWHDLIEWLEWSWLQYISLDTPSFWHMSMGMQTFVDVAQMEYATKCNWIEWMKLEYLKFLFENKYFSGVFQYNIRFVPFFSFILIFGLNFFEKNHQPSALTVERLFWFWMVKRSLSTRNS